MLSDFYRRRRRDSATRACTNLCVRAHGRVAPELILGEVFFLIIGRPAVRLADSPDRFYDATCKIGQQCITATYRKPGSENRRARARCNLGLQNTALGSSFTKEKCQPR